MENKVRIKNLKSLLAFFEKFSQEPQTVPEYPLKLARQLLASQDALPSQLYDIFTTIAA